MSSSSRKAIDYGQAGSNSATIPDWWYINRRNLIILILNLNGFLQRVADKGFDKFIDYILSLENLPDLIFFQEPKIQGRKNDHTVPLEEETRKIMETVFSTGPFIQYRVYCSFPDYASVRGVISLVLRTIPQPKIFYNISHDWLKTDPRSLHTMEVPPHAHDKHGSGMVLVFKRCMFLNMYTPLSLAFKGSLNELVHCQRYRGGGPIDQRYYDLKQEIRKDYVIALANLANVCKHYAFPMCACGDSNLHIDNDIKRYARANYYPTKREDNRPELTKERIDTYKLLLLSNLLNDPFEAFHPFESKTITHFNPRYPDNLIRIDKYLLDEILRACVEDIYIHEPETRRGSHGSDHKIVGLVLKTSSSYEQSQSVYRESVIVTFNIHDQGKFTAENRWNNEIRLAYNKLGGEWNRNKKFWLFPLDNLLQVAKELNSLPNVNVRIVNFDVVLCKAAGFDRDANQA